MKIYFWYKGLIKITKPLNIFYAMVTQLFVYIWAVPDQNHNFIEFIPVSISMAAVMAAGYLINAYYDVKIDMVNRPKKVVIGRYLSRRRVMVFHAFFSALGVGLGFFANYRIGLLNLCLLFLLWLYSNALKRTALLGNMTLAFLSTSILWSVCVHSQVFNYAVVIYSVFAFFIETIRHLLKDIIDFKGDEVHGVATYPVKYGILGTKRVIYGLSALGYLLSLGFVFYAQNSALSYGFSALGILLVIFLYKLYFADRKKHFSFLINLCKATIFLGVLSIFIS
jgi:4-hydroxybenzoate polyprenyltransferase